MTTKTKTTPALDIEAIVTQAVAAAMAAAGTPQVQARQAREPRSVAVRVLTGTEAAKYGDVSIGKLNNGEFQPKIGLRKEDITGLVTALRAAAKELA